jgi:hypothetical protein
MTITYLLNVIATISGNKTPYELLFGCKPKLNLSLKTFGEIGVVTTKDKIQENLRNRGSTCTLAGYTYNHSRDVSPMLNLKSRRAVNSRDVFWLNKMYKGWIIEKSIIYKTF